VELRTPDLVIRPPVPEDAAEAFELLNDPDVRRLNPARECPDLATAEEWFRDGADWSAGSHATWHAVLRDTGRMVGNVSLFAIDGDDRVAEIGYRVLPRARGRGVARQMVDAVTRWAFSERDLARVQLAHAVPHLASCRVALAAGFVPEGTTRSAYEVPDGTRDDCHHPRPPGHGCEPGARPPHDALSGTLRRIRDMAGRPAR
jgi:RimJ/RimL family protein N-acetyltransferase